MQDYLAVSDAALKLSEMIGIQVSPRRLTALFYDRRLPDTSCMMIGGRRLIKHDALHLIADQLITLSSRAVKKGLQK